MPRFNRQSFSRIPSKPSEVGKKDSRKNDSTSPSKGVTESVRSEVPTSINLKRSKQPTLPHNVLSSEFGEMKTTTRMPPKSTIKALQARSPLKSQTSSGSLPPFCKSPISKNHIRSNAVSGELMHKEQESSRFLSISAGTGKLTRHRATELARQGLPWHSRETKRLSFAKRLQLFRALSREPLSFLDLHVRFGVSKQTIRRLVKNHFLVEVWGPNDIGVQFKLTKESKNHLNELETAAKYDSKIVEKSPIRLKNKI
jgi:hypothetical protein